MSFNTINTEQVSKYHPDKYADQISDFIVDFVLSQNPNAHCAIEAMVKDSTVVVAGEVSGYDLSYLEIVDSVNQVSKDLNYPVTNILNLIGIQSVEINSAVRNDDIAAGDQGFVYGFATRETPEFLPLGLYIANQIIYNIERYAYEYNYTILKGDAKTQVVTTNNIVEKIVVSVCFNNDYPLDHIKSIIKTMVIKVLNKNNIYYNVELIINPSGVWTIGGPVADSGLTGRKIVADQYGGYMPVGGGAFSGKDLTKVDRSAAYMARKIAVEILKENPTIDWVKIQVGYAIGITKPISLDIITNLGSYEFIENYRERFKVSNMLSELKHLNLYELSQGNHFRGNIISE